MVAPFSGRTWARTWLSTAVTGTLLLALWFAGYETVERAFLRGTFADRQLWWLHIARGMSASIMVGTWAFLNVWRMRRAYDRAFAESYRAVERTVAERTKELRDQEKLAALGVLSSGIAHDIANPLASLSSELEMLESEGADQADPARTRASLATLRHHVERIERTLREMTDFARRRGDEFAAVSVGHAVDDALRLVRHDQRARQVRFAVEIAPELAPVRMVEDHLVMVLVNLLINALDAMPDGGEVTIRARAEGEFVRLSVSDTGTGMSEEVLRRSTEPLFTTKTGGRGTGLGLSVSVDVLRAVGGSLGLESRPGEGTTVYLNCPTDPAQRKPCRNAS